MEDPFEMNGLDAQGYAEHNKRQRQVQNKKSLLAEMKTYRVESFEGF